MRLGRLDFDIGKIYKTSVTFIPSPSRMMGWWSAMPSLKGRAMLTTESLIFDFEQLLVIASLALLFVLCRTCHLVRYLHTAPLSVDLTPFIVPCFD